VESTTCILSHKIAIKTTYAAIIKFIKKLFFYPQVEMETKKYKFSQQSIKELRLLDKDGAYPGCKRPEAEHLIQW
jgi:hypothetical protein